MPRSVRAQAFQPVNSYMEVRALIGHSDFAPDSPRRPKSLSVLVVDQVEETGEVLQAALGDRVRVLSAAKARQGLEMAREHHPDLIVLDLELAEQGKSTDQFRSQNPGGETSLVLLGKARRGAPESESQQDEFMPKPYHYGKLVRKIEELLKRAA